MNRPIRPHPRYRRPDWTPTTHNGIAQRRWTVTLLWLLTLAILLERGGVSCR